MTGVLWPSFYTGDGSRIRKWLYGSVLVRDWDPAGSTDMTNITVFDADGNLSPTLLQTVASGGQGFFDVGSITENGVEFNPQFSVDETYVWQSRRTQRTDVTKDDEEVMFSCAESVPIVDYLYNNLPIGFKSDLNYVPSVGTAGYSVTKPFYTDTVQRQLLIIGVDGSIGTNGQPEYIVELRPRVTLSKKAKRQWGSKQIDVRELTFQCHIDPYSGFDAKTLRGGIVWLDEGGPVVLPTVATITPTATGATTASLVFNQPTSPNQPFTYAVESSADGATGWVARTSSSVTTNGVVTTSVTGLTTITTYYFRVTVTAANGQTAVYPVTTSITTT